MKAIKRKVFSDSPPDL